MKLHTVPQKFGVEGLQGLYMKNAKNIMYFVNTITPGTPIKTSMSKKTYSDEKRENMERSIFNFTSVSSFRSTNKKCYK